MVFNQALHKKYSILYYVYLLGFSLCGEIYAINDADECNENQYFNYNGFNESNCALHLSTEKDAVLRGCNFSGCKIEGPKTIYLVGCNLNEVEFDSNITKVHLRGCSFNNLKFAPNTIIISDQTNAGHIDNIHFSTPDVIIINDHGSIINYGSLESMVPAIKKNILIPLFGLTQLLLFSWIIKYVRR